MVNKEKHKRRSNLDLARIFIGIITVCLLATAALAAAELSRIWEKELTTASFTIMGGGNPPPQTGVLSAFLSNSWNTYQTQNEKLDLSDGKIMLAFTQNSYSIPILLDVTYTSTASDMVLSATGQYVSLSWADSTQVINTMGSPFSIPTDGSLVQLVTANMIWDDCAEIGTVGFALEISFSLDTALVSSGTYTYQVNLGLSV